MSAFTQPLDIQNRALQLCGATRIASISEDSKNNSETSFVYDKVRRAELRRNVWTFATRRAVLRPVDTTTMHLLPATWDPAKTYLIGTIIAYGGHTYVAVQNVPLNIEPDLATNYAYWSQYFGPMTVTPWVNPAVPPPVPSTLDVFPTGGYFTGELVYAPSGPSPGVYLSMITGNAVDPTVVPAWDPTVVYNVGQTVTYSSVVYQSLEDLNINITPVVGPAWILVPATQPVQMMGQSWLKLNATVRSLQFIYPIGSGPITQSATRNIYILPNGFLREAPQDPKAGSVSYLGAPSGLTYDDWVYENGCIVTREVFPLTFRFVADIADVTLMDDMFCEGLACRCAIEIVEILTQSAGKKNQISAEYQHFMTEARAVNGIEQGSTESPEDDYITCRR